MDYDWQSFWRFEVEAEMSAILQSIDSGASMEEVRQMVAGYQVQLQGN